MQFGVGAISCLAILKYSVRVQCIILVQPKDKIKWLTWTQKSLKKLWKVIFHTIVVEEAVVCVNGRHMSGILCQSVLAGSWHVRKSIARMIKT